MEHVPRINLSSFKYRLFQKAGRLSLVQPLQTRYIISSMIMFFLQKRSHKFSPVIVMSRDNRPPPGPSSRRPAGLEYKNHVMKLRRIEDQIKHKTGDKKLHCGQCDVWVRSKEQMSAHKDGANHKRKKKEDQEEENRKLKLEIKNLKRYIRLAEEKEKECKNEHGQREHYRKYKQFYLNNVRPK